MIAQGRGLLPNAMITSMPAHQVKNKENKPQNMKVSIEIEIPEGVDLSHTYESVTDAMYFADNVTQAEFNLIENIISKLIPND